MGGDFLILFLENEQQDLQLELHYAEQNVGEASVTITSPRFDNPRLQETFTVGTGRTFDCIAKHSSCLCILVNTCVVFAAEFGVLGINPDFQARSNPNGDSAFFSSKAIKISSSRAVSVTAINKASGSCGGCVLHSIAHVLNLEID